MSEESEDNKAATTAWAPHLYVRGQSLVMSEEPVPEDEATHGRWNKTAIPYK